MRGALEEIVTGQEARREAQLAADDEDHLGPGLADLLGPLRALGEQRQHLLGGQIARER
ncbi:hypothetical protein [Kribbella sp. NBC_00889]|uniref:hypothetical protein n=1 Tax=Kribbella sp. NBC_00889 TaxID=2975974 RepID=UPI00386B1E18|nr:hypothetical protein OG817_31920 [Kribbella sp. NBC_00889]